jgi:hypothetical protein
MKRLILFAMISAIAVQSIYGQRAKKHFAAVKWQTLSMQRWGVESIELPDNLWADPDDVQPSKNGDVTWNTYTARWTPIPARSGPKITEINIFSTIWDQELAKVVPDLRPELATPENLMKADIEGDIRNKLQKDALVEEAGYYKINGITGGLTQGRVSGRDGAVMLIWSTYRYYKDKPQRVSMEIVIDRREIKSAMRIIDSLKLQQPN